MKTTRRSLGAIGAAIALLAALAVPATASAADEGADGQDGQGRAVVLKGHITTYGGKPIAGVVVEVKALFGDTFFDKGVKTSATGRFAITVKPNATYALFIGESSDDMTAVREFVAKTGHLRVGTTDYRLDKSLHHAD